MNRELLQQALDALEFPHDSEWSNKAKTIEALQHALTQLDKKEQRMTDEQIADSSYKMQIACNKSTSDSDINIIKLIQHIENLYEQGRAEEREACAKLCLEPIHYGQFQNNKSTVGGNKYVRDKTAQECAYLIRARGEK